MQLEYSTLSGVFFWATTFFVIIFCLYRKYVYSIIDPLFTYVYTTSFASVLILYVVQDDKNIVHYFLCHFSLFLGFVLCYKLNERDSKISVFHFYDEEILKKTVYILFCLYFFSNLFIILTRGSAFFSDDPYARETNFEGGFGIFRRINWGVGSFLASSLTMLFLLQKKKIFLYLMIILSLFTMLEGTKSSLLRIVIIVGAMVYHPYVKDKHKISEKIKNYIPIGITILLFAFFYILLKESKGSSDVFLSFINRLLAGADSVLYFYLPQNEYLRYYYHPVDYVSYVTNPITGFLHLTSYMEPFGSLTVSNTQVGPLKTDVYLAPNTPFYIDGQIYFGYYGAFIYSAVIGYVIASFRKLFFDIKKSSYFTLCLLCAMFYHSLTVTVEISLFVKSCLDTLLFSVPVYLIVSLIYTKKIRLQKLLFN